MGWDGMRWDGMGWDGMGWDEMGWDEIAELGSCRMLDEGLVYGRLTLLID